MRFTCQVENLPTFGAWLVIIWDPDYRVLSKMFWDWRNLFMVLRTPQTQRFFECGVQRLVKLMSQCNTIFKNKPIIKKNKVENTVNGPTVKYRFYIHNGGHSTILTRQSKISKSSKSSILTDN